MLVKLLERLDEALRRSSPFHTRSCGCHGMSYEETQRTELIIRDSHGADYIEEKKRFIGQVPAWHGTELVKALKIREYESYDYYVEERSRLYLYYFCEECGEPFRVLHEEKVSRDYRDGSIDEKLAGEVPEADAGSEDVSDPLEDVEDEAVDDVVPMDSDEAVKESILEHTNKRGAESDVSELSVS